jgi:O-antigen ligase
LIGMTGLAWAGHRSVLAENSFFYLCAIVVAGCLVLGGATTTGALSDVILQLLAIPLLVASLWRLTGRQLGLRPPSWALVFCAALVLVPLLQVVPLPPRLWTVLPNREAETGVFELLQRDLPWMPISTSPQATWLSVLSLIPPLTVFLGTLLLDHVDRRLLSVGVLVFGAASVFLGLSQVAQGPTSSLRFFEVTNESEAVGFFANRNHFAAFLYSLTVFAAVWAVEAANAIASARRKFATRGIVALLASFTTLVLLIAAQAMARSRAGIGLTMIALLGGLALAASDRRNTTGLTPTRLLLAAVALAAMFVVQFTLYRLLERFSDDPLRDARITFARLTIPAAKLFMPLGSGMGTFIPVYASQEKPADAMIDSFANRAHNDVLELWLEAGVAGLGLMALFLGWLLAAARRLWRQNVASREIDLSLARAATIVVALIVVHSFVDYPLRTGAMMAVLAFACGLMFDPVAMTQDGPPRDSTEQGVDADHGAVAASIASAAQQPTSARAVRKELAETPKVADAPTQPSSERWGTDMDWPEEWRPSSNRQTEDAKRQPPSPPRAWPKK